MAGLLGAPRVMTVGLNRGPQPAFVGSRTRVSVAICSLIIAPLLAFGGLRGSMYAGFGSVLRPRVTREFSPLVVLSI